MLGMEFGPQSGRLPSQWTPNRGGGPSTHSPPGTQLLTPSPTGKTVASGGRADLEERLAAVVPVARGPREEQRMLTGAQSTHSQHLVRLPNDAHQLGPAPSMLPASLSISQPVGGYFSHSLSDGVSSQPTNPCSLHQTPGVSSQWSCSIWLQWVFTQ